MIITLMIACDAVNALMIWVGRLERGGGEFGDTVNNDVNNDVNNNINNNDFGECL